MKGTSEGERVLGSEKEPELALALARAWGEPELRLGTVRMQGQEPEQERSQILAP